jgi:hypothetical protein
MSGSSWLDLHPRLLEILGELDDDEVRVYLLPDIRAFVARRLGEQQTQKIFLELGSRRYAADQANSSLLMNYLMTEPENKAEFLRARVAYNKTLPRAQRRGAGGTSVSALRHHLDAALREYRKGCAKDPDPETAEFIRKQIDKSIAKIRLGQKLKKMPHRT